MPANGPRRWCRSGTYSSQSSSSLCTTLLQSNQSSCKAISHTFKTVLDRHRRDADMTRRREARGLEIQASQIERDPRPGSAKWLPADDKACDHVITQLKFVKLANSREILGFELEKHRRAVICPPLLVESGCTVTKFLCSPSGQPILAPCMAALLTGTRPA